MIILLITVNVLMKSICNNYDYSKSNGEKNALETPV
jgi:hypothetical protein